MESRKEIRSSVGIFGIIWKIVIDSIGKLTVVIVVSG